MVSVSAIIPTFGRGTRCLIPIARILECDPQPSEIIVHVDNSDDSVEKAIASAFPGVKLLSSRIRIGPGGSRHQCLLHCQSDFAASFDDDSYPVDRDYFDRVEAGFRAYPDVAVIGATIWHQNQAELPRQFRFVRKADFTGCGHAVRLSAYRQTRGYLPLPVAYGMEELDLAIQLFAQGWKILQAGELRVFHDTELKHHQSSEITANSVANAALFAFLHYPARGWTRGLLQVLNKSVDSLRRKRVLGITTGLLSAPKACWNFKRYRAPLPWPVVKDFLQLRTAEQAQ
jgi:GT2 family glycosyltransferase